MSEHQHRLSLTHLDRYRFDVDFGDAGVHLRTDEPEPIGGGDGPAPEKLLAASVANCLCASLYFAMTKHRQEPAGMKAEAVISTGRNARGRLRVEAIDVAIELAGADYEREPLDRALRQFQDFCTVSESVKAGIPVRVSVRDALGNVLLAERRDDDAARPGGAEKPEDLVRMFAERANAGNLEGLVALYEADATVAAGAPVAQGRDGIREFYAGVLARKSEFPVAEVDMALRNGEIALTVARLPNGNISIEVARRQKDGSWKWAIDQLKVKRPDK